ncbi:Sterol uptake control protein 2 [Pleurostoma richardsiae]|uniref:Sterol uptake control protein 2 n=1 Tax=Pleurostoma richardsiae TaxID=41990 RepID=A0AA38R5H6_9PEZI|nr:Sterol uptake control protein 2 [Pleurostoma richardsiae]
MASEVPVKLETQTSSSQASGSSGGNRKERGAIAAQACDTCRSRKQKCDEQRPKCSTCQKFKLECRYREPVPTKKDRTLVEILDRIKALEDKIDSLGIQGRASSVYGPLAGSTSLQSSSSTSVPIASPTFPPTLQSADSSGSITGTAYRYVSSVHQMLAWPIFQQLLQNASPRIPNFNSGSIEQDGLGLVLGVHHGPGALPLPAVEPFIQAMHPMDVSGHAATPTTAPHLTSPLDWDTVQRLSTSYFDSFNLLYPIVDRENFFSTLHMFMADVLDGGIAATLAYLVFALGEVALAATKGQPLNVFNRRPSGVKGGNASQPPGLAFFNEARRRMGFNLTECTVENVQIFALAGLYYESCFRHMEFWRMTTSASLACQALLTSNPGDLTSPRADLIRRVFWHCSIMETALHMELGLPRTGLDKFESLVKVPDFSGTFSRDDYVGNQTSHFQQHFASQILLRRLIVSFHGVLSNETDGSPSSTFGLRPPTGENGSPLPAAITPMALQLDQWRSTILPVHLRWQDDQSDALAGANRGMFGQSTFSSGSSSVSNPTRHLMFTADLDSEPASYPYVEDVQVAMLRTRYYYAKYIIHRPYLYKALHTPGNVTQEDADGVAECLRACLKWPVAMSPTCTHKRLVPCLFFWTQNLLGILLVLHMSRQVPILSRIRSTLCGDRFEMEANETVGLALDWIRDLKALDPAAKWAWEIVRSIYELGDD